MDKKLSRSVYILIICALFLSTSITAFITKSAYDMNIDELTKHIGTMDIKDEDLSISGFRIEKTEKDGYLSKIKDINGRSFFVYRDNAKLIKLTIYGLIPILLISIMLLFLMRYYNEKRLLRALKPVERMAGVITDILSGKSSEGDPEAVFNEIRPLLKVEGVNKNELERSIENLIEAEQRRREFTANVTHELKTPLTSINGYAEMISSGIANDEDIVKFSNIILEEGNRLLRLIDEILTLSKYDNDSRDKLNYEQFDLFGLASDIVGDMSAYALSEEINLNIKGEKLVVSADVNMMEEMISNLTSNSIKYNYPGGNVYIEVEDAEDEAKIIVRDDGIGISPEDQERIFERFYMVNKSGSRKLGTGLGLSLVKHIVKKHNGSIDLKSQIGKGSTFTIMLPKHPDVI